VNFPKWKRFIIQVLQAKGCWTHIEGTDGVFDIFPKSPFDLHDCLSNAKLRDHQDLDHYLGDFKDARLCFISMGVTYTEFEMVHHIIRGIPDSGVWGHFRQLMTQMMQDHVEWERRATMKCELDTLLNQIIMHLTIECQRLESENWLRVHPKQGPGSKYTNFSHDGPIRKHAHNPKGVQCTNCGQRSHDCDHCYREGGGMAGQGPCMKVGQQTFPFQG